MDDRIDRSGRRRESRRPDASEVLIGGRGVLKWSGRVLRSDNAMPPSLFSSRIMSAVSSMPEIYDRATWEQEGRPPVLSLPLVRLLQLVMILQNGRFPNARRLAEVCAVSRRTIYRDLATLEAAGIPVVYRADRQGYQLAGPGFLQPAPLNDQEALSLLLLSRWCHFDHPFGSLKPIQNGVDKVIQALPEGLRERITLGGELITSGSDPSSLDRTPERRPVYDAIWQALTRADRCGCGIAKTPPIPCSRPRSASTRSPTSIPAGPSWGGRRSIGRFVSSESPGSIGWK